MKNRSANALSFVLLVLAIAGVTPSVFAQTVTNYGLNGCSQQSPGILAQGRDGNLYSSASSCANNFPGAVFEISPNGVMNVLFDFYYSSLHGPAPYGAGSKSGLTIGTDGNFYGTTTQGGAVDDFGVIFRITSSGSVTTLYSFTNGTDGATPYGPPIQGADGNFYGTTFSGTAYKITPSGTFTALGAIPGRLSFSSFSQLLLGADGYLYGTTYEGGSSGFGTVFKMSP
jgi:uncharacterized repeat protein (TIGR03803 family)